MGNSWMRIERFGQTLFLRHNTHALPQNVGHFHHDLGHFCMYKDGVPVFIDGGRLNYTNSSLSRFGRYPESHNVVLIDGLGLLPRREAWYPSDYSISNFNIWQAELEECSEIKIQAEGFQRIEENITWERTVRLFDGGTEIVDKVTGSGRHCFSSYFHWAPELDVRNSKAGEYIILGPNINGCISFTMPSELNIQLHKGGKNPVGWQVISYGTAIESTTMELSGKIDLPIQVLLQLSWKKG